MKTKNLLSLKWLGLIFCFIISTGINAQTPVSKNGQLKVVGLKLCNQYGNPIQLRGMSTHGIQWYGWGSCLTEASLDALAYDWGSDILRISLYVQEGGWETNPSGFTAQVNTLIAEASERGMYALVDWHQLSPGDPNANLANAKTFFTSIANTNKDRNNIIYDICNEPNGVSWAKIKTYADQIIPVIRNIDSDAVILIGTHAWGSMGISDGRNAQDIVSNPVNFPNIMYTFHFYAADHGDEYYNELNWASDRLPVFITEFGTQEASGDGPNNFTMSQKYIDLLRAKKISWTNWNYSDDFRSGAVWTTGTCSNGPWTTARLKPAGAKVREWMLNPADDFPGGGGNIAPSVSITSPANNASYNTGAVVTINASASDADGSVSKVEFFVDGTKIGEDATLPYSFNWTSTVGTHSLTAKATDNLNLATTSSAVSISVTTPVTQGPYGGTVRNIPGKIEAEHYDLGGQNVAYNDLSTGNTGNAFRTDAVDIEATTDGGAGFNVGWVQAGEWLEYTVNVVTAGTYKLEARVATNVAGKTFHVEMDGQNVSGTITVPNTTDWQIWQTVSVTTTSLTTGQKIMRIVFDAGDFNLNSLTFSTITNENQAPTVSITSPANNASFTTGTVVTINANATDDGGVAKVEFFVDGSKIGEDLSSPYTINWTSTVGTHSLTAKATDNLNLATTSSAISISVTNPSTQSPYGGTVRNIPGQIQAEHYDLGGSGIAFNDLTTGNSGNSFRTDAVDIEATNDGGPGFNIGWTQTNEWLEYTVNVTAAGVYKLEARVAATATGKKFRVEMDGVNISGSITIPNTTGWQIWQTVTVNTTSLTAGQKIMRIFMETGDFNLNYVTFSSTIANNAPTVNITSPANGTSFAEGTTITINADAADSDGSVAKVEFFRGTTLIGSDNALPYTINWTGATAGTYSLTAKVTDNLGAVTTSSAVSVTVTGVPNNPPTTSITSPAGGATYTAPANITINADAADSDGTISKVEFFRGTTKIGEDAISPFSITWTGAAAGSYALTTKATDNKGAVTTSAAVSITVNPSTNTCSGVAQYVENGGYVAGSKVQNAGNQYQCNPWPASGWCNGASWAYAPGTGSYWADAWTLVGSCSGSRSATIATNASLVSSVPNPFANSTIITVTVETAGETSVIVYDHLGREVAVLAKGYLSADTYSFNLDGKNLQSGIYVCKFINNEKVVSTTISKQ